MMGVSYSAPRIFLLFIWCVVYDEKVTGNVDIFDLFFAQDVVFWEDRGVLKDARDGHSFSSSLSL